MSNKVTVKDHVMKKKLYSLGDVFYIQTKSDGWMDFGSLAPDTVMLAKIGSNSEAKKDLLSLISIESGEIVTRLWVTQSEIESGIPRTTLLEFLPKEYELVLMKYAVIQKE